MVFFVSLCLAWLNGVHSFCKQEAKSDNGNVYSKFYIITNLKLFLNIQDHTHTHHHTCICNFQHTNTLLLQAMQTHTIHTKCTYQTHTCVTHTTSVQDFLPLTTPITYCLHPYLWSLIPRRSDKKRLRSGGSPLWLVVRGLLWMTRWTNIGQAATASKASSSCICRHHIVANNHFCLALSSNTQLLLLSFQWFIYHFRPIGRVAQKSSIPCMCLW